MVARLCVCAPATRQAQDPHKCKDIVATGRLNMQRQRCSIVALTELEFSDGDATPGGNNQSFTLDMM